MVLSFALCATFAFAQSNKSVSKYQVIDKNVTTENETIAQKAGYTGSIFTKDVTLFSCDFSQDQVGYTTGIVGAGEEVNGTAIGQHGQVAAHAQWRRLPSNSYAAISAMDFFGATNYPASSNEEIWGWRWLVCGEAGGTPFASNTPDAGIMVMTMQDQITNWGGHGTIATFDAYMKFGPIITTGQPLVRVRFYQFYRAFNSDQCWIDYSTDGETWNGIEINVAHVDLDVNTNIKGWKTVTMPSVLGDKNTVYFRLRWFCSEQNGAYGYFWFVDDFQVIDALDNSLNLRSNKYFEGFYQMMPQNLQLPVVWAAEFSNDGKNNQTNFTGHIYTYASGDANATELVSKNIGTVVPEPFDVRSVVIDPLGWYDSAEASHGWSYNIDNVPTGPTAYLPTATTGTRHFFSDLTTDHYSTHIYGDTGTFDTLRYSVNWQNTSDGHPYGIWGRDHGAVRKFSYYCAGLVGPSTFSTTLGETMASSAGYGVYVSYVTGNQVPTDANGNPWRILGMEMVSSTQLGHQGQGSHIEPIVFRDEEDSAGRLHFYYVNTGASTHVVQSSEVFSASQLEDLTYEVYGNYPTVKIMFPNQPELLPNTSFRVGYELTEESDFLVSTAGNYYYTLEDSTAVGFFDEDGMNSYGHALNIINRYSVMVSDPYDGQIHMYSTSQYPMIRFLIGPSYYVPKYGISLECDNPDWGYFSDGADDLCGTVDSVPETGSASYLVIPQEGYKIDKILYNGEEIEWSIRFDADSVPYGQVTIENVNAHGTLKCFFKEGIGFDPVANVSMRLQPNPATSNVNIVMKGATGVVNMALIDMSGRVVSTSQFNAENGYNLNVSNLAKGAYFVRITNNKFNKIEKLIVR